MSQAHKARINASNIRKKNIFSMAKKSMEMLKGEARRMELDPKLNPAGKAKFDSSKSEYHMRVGPVPEGPKKVFTPFPDPAHSARLRGNKARGTDSSSKRVPVK